MALSAVISAADADGIANTRDITSMINNMFLLFIVLTSLEKNGCVENTSKHFF
jgi:hypothetical protein